MHQDLLANHTLPDPTPKPMVLPNTAEHAARYSEGNHIKFFELYVIQHPSKLKAMPLYRGCWTSALFRGTIECDRFPKLIVPISV